MSSNMFDVEAFILVGGQSSRMGSDKSKLVLGHQTAVEHIRAALCTITPRIKVVGATDQEAFGDLQNVPDTHERWGALGGIHAALSAGQSEWALIVACDLPLVSADLFARLGQIASSPASESCDAVVPIQPDGRPQPLCGLYRRESCWATAGQVIMEGEHKPRTLLARVRMRWAAFDELSDLPGARDFFLNMNTPDDFQRAQEILAARSV
jgi:molybdopterin-guanine dinucleotide biosynthesis protein A